MANEITENIKKNHPERRMILYMMAVENALYTSDKTSQELKEILGKCETHIDGGSSKSTRTLQNVIKSLKDAYEREYGIDAKESIRVSRGGAIPKYILGDKARCHLLFPEKVFYDKIDRDKMNLLLKVGEYFSLPMEAFLRKESIIKVGSDRLFGGHIEVRERPFDSKVFAEVFNAVENGHVITFKYESLTTTKNSSANSSPIVTPYYLKTYNNKWYLIGHVKKSTSRWTVFALDRICDVRECPDTTPYEITPGVIESFYENVIGFFVPPNPDGSFPQSEKELDIKEITIILKNERSAYFLKKNPIHKSQKQSRSNPLEFKLICLDNIHLYQALLHILDDIRWVEPSVVRNRLVAKLEESKDLLKTQPFCVEEL